MGRRFRFIGCALLAAALCSGAAHAAEWSSVKKYPITRHIKAIDFYASKHGALVGNRAAVGLTEDGGLTWVTGSLNAALPPHKKNSTFLDVQFLDSQHAWIVGENAVLFETKNGGKEWTLVPTPARDVLNGVWFVDPDHGWIGGDGGLVFKTTDGGVTWEQLNTRTNNSIRGFFFKDALNGTVVGDGGTILSTEDGGNRWRDMKSPSAMSLKTVQYIGDRGWVIGGNGAALVSEDAGKTWEEGASNVPNSNGMPEPIWSLHFIDEQNGAAAAEFGVVLLTTDGGHEWAPVDPRPTQNRLNDVEWLDSSTILAVGEFGTIVRSTDAGATWESIWSNPDLFNISFAGGGDGWAVGTGGSVFHTSDDGATWEQEPMAVPFQLFGVSAISSSSAYIIGDNRTFFERDGSAWEPIQNPRSETGGEARIEANDGAELALATYAIDFSPSGKVGWIVGDLAKAIRTGDGGQLWVSKTPNVQMATINTLYGVAAVDDNNVFAVGAAGTIVHSSDGGETWVEAEKPGDVFEELRDASFTPDMQHGWVVGYAGAILSWDGAKFVSQTNASTADLYGVHAVSGTEAWAVGAGGTLLHTMDGGVTWLRDRGRLTGLTFHDITVNDAGAPYAVGQWGIIVAYK